MIIAAVKGLQIIDSRGNPTVKAYITLNDGSVHSSSVPSGASIGVHEAKELRDLDPKHFFGQGVRHAIENIETHIRKAIIGKRIDSPRMIDEVMLRLDHTSNKSVIGANSMLAVSQAMLKAAAFASNIPLWKYINDYYFPQVQPSYPRLFINVINGGRHANWSFDIQEFVIAPKKNIPSVSVRVGVEIFQSIKRELIKRKLSILVGDEGGESPQLESNEEVFELIRKSALSVNYTLGVDYDFGIDSAASQLFQDGRYFFKKDNIKLSSEGLIERYKKYIDDFHISFFEDQFAEDDWEAFVMFTKISENKYVVIGDDLFATNIERIEKGIKINAAGGIIIKPNQIGTILETVEAIKLAKSAGWVVIISHRSGDTEDTFIADLAYGCGADFIKTGSMSRSERLAKYNRLLEIEFFESGV